MTGPVTCASCGEGAPERPVTWAVEQERGETRAYCERCTRKNVRSIEGRLDARWWGA